MILGIDASNIRGGGGLTHLVELLSAADPLRHGFDRVVVWAAADALAKLPKRPWLQPVPEPDLSGSLLRRVFWQWWHLPRRVEAFRCGALWILRGGYRRCACPVVTMSHNLLPFEWRELVRYGLSSMTPRLVVLRCAQSWAFRRADGVIFLNRYARATVERVTGPIEGRVAIIPHAAAYRFGGYTERARAKSGDAEFRFLYASTIAPYKHQWGVVAAITRLRNRGWPVTLELVGGAHPASLKRLVAVQRRCDPEARFVHYAGPLPYKEIERNYAAADAVVFASSCENMPITLLEGMTTGLPVASSNRGPMPEILRDAAVYFDPENIDEIESALLTILSDAPTRQRLGVRAKQYVSEFSWQQSAEETFEFISAVARVPRRHA